MDKKETIPEVDRLKELFEYEMTGVLLHFKQEQEIAENDLLREYMEMEIPSGAVKFQPPESKADFVQVPFAEVGKVALGDVQLQAEDLTVPPIAYQNLSLSEMKFQVVQPVLEQEQLKIAGSSAQLSAVACPVLERSMSDMAESMANACKVGDFVSNLPLSGDELSQTSENMKTLERVTPEIDLPEVKRIKKIRNILTHSSADSINIQLPTLTPNAGKVALQTESAPEVKLDVRAEVPKLVKPFADFAPIHVDVQKFAGNASVLEQAVGKMVSLSETVQQNRIRISTDVSKYLGMSMAFSPLKVEKQPIHIEIHYDAEAINNAPCHIRNVEIEQEHFPTVSYENPAFVGNGKIDAITPDDISIEIKPTTAEKQFSAPSLSSDTSVKAEYPEIPPKPDFSAYYQNILDTVKAG